MGFAPARPARGRRLCRKSCSIRRRSSGSRFCKPSRSVARARHRSDQGVGIDAGYMRYDAAKLVWEDVQSDYVLQVGQFLKFGAAVGSDSKSENVEIAEGSTAMIEAIDAGGDAKVAMLRAVGFSTLAYSVGSYWFLRKKLSGVVQAVGRHMVSEPPGVSAGVPSPSTGGRSAK